MPRRCGGFTLIESLVAMALVVIIALGSAQLFTIAIARTFWAREQLAMSLIASTKVDDLAAAAAAGTIAISPSDAIERSIDGCADISIDNGRAYVLRWRIARVPKFGDDVVSILVRVTPAGGAGEVRMAAIREWRQP